MSDFKFGLGSFRFLLAFFVVISHLWFKMIQGYAAYSVWGFYVLSGYLMTYILCHKYGFSRKGLIAYAKNRCLRILPMYYIAVICGIFSILFLHYHLDRVDTEIGSLVLSHRPIDWAFALTLCKIFPNPYSPVPIANALGIEVCAYFLMPFLARWRTVTWATLVLSLWFNYHLKLGAETFYSRYNAFWPCLAPFAAGALLVHYRTQLRKLLLGSPFISVLAWLGYGLTIKIDSGWPWSHGLYVSILFSAWAVLALVEVKPSRLDTMAGDLSYPVYLFHMTVGLWFMLVFGYSRNLRFFLASYAATLLVSWLLVRYVDKLLKKFKAPPIIKPMAQPRVSEEDPKTIARDDTAVSRI
jgi:peptidoglycan/LPS O-acetylase OafA/YrhL